MELWKTFLFFATHYTKKMTSICSRDLFRKVVPKPKYVVKKPLHCNRDSGAPGQFSVLTMTC